jgi:hypothetical protein
MAKDKHRHILSEKELDALLWWNEDDEPLSNKRKSCY